MPHPRVVTIAVAALGLLLLAAGAWWWNRDAAPTPVTIRTSFFLVSAPLLVAEEYGDFAAEGLSVQLRFHETGRQALAAMLEEGGQGYATAADTPLMHAACAQRRFAIIATVGETRDGVRILGRRGAGIAGPADLAGKRMGTPVGTNGDYYLRSYLAMNGIPLDGISTVYLPPDEVAAGLLSGRFDAVSLWEPYLGRLRGALGADAIVLHEPSLYQFSWNLVRGDRPADADTERRLLRALGRAARRLELEPEVRTWAGRRIGLPESEASGILAACYFRPHLNHGLITAMEDQARVLLDEPDPEIDFNHVIDPTALLATDPNSVRLIR